MLQRGSKKLILSPGIQIWKTTLEAEVHYMYRQIFFQVDCVVTTAGGIEEDFIKCLAPTYLGDFHLKGKDLRERGINRIGNLLAPNDNYCLFEEWITPILDSMVQEQTEQVSALVWPASET